MSRVPRSKARANVSAKGRAGAQRAPLRGSDGASSGDRIDRWFAHGFGVVFLTVQVLYVSAAYSQFRLPKMSVAVIGVATICAAWMLVHRSRVTLPKDPLLLVLAAYPVILVVSALWSTAPFFTLEGALSAAVWIVAVAVLAEMGAGARRLVIRWLVVGFLLSAGVLVLQVSGQDPLGLEGSLVVSRLGLTGLAGNPSDMAMVASLLIALLAVPVSVTRAARKRTLLQIGLGVCLLAAVVLLTRNLTGLVSLAGMALVGLLHAPRRARWVGAAGVAVVLAVAIALAPGIRARIGKVATAVAKGDVYTALSAREDGWSAAFQMVADRPVLGVGGGGYGCAFYAARLAWLEAHQETGRRGELSTHFEWAHNEPLQIVSELGVLGWIWLGGLAVAVVARRRTLAHPLWADLFLVGCLPFLVLHYPLRVAVSLAVCAVAGAELIARSSRPELELAVWGRRMVVAGVVGLAAVAVVGEVRDLRRDLWRARMEMTLERAAASPPQVRTALVKSVIADVDGRASSLGSPSWLHRVKGRGQLLAGSPVEAEASFRQALVKCPHSEAELGLGLALAAQGDRNRGLVHLANACTVNPKLLRFVEDRTLRKAVAETISVSRGGTGTSSQLPED